MIRPEVSALLTRWREAAAGGGVVAAGLLLALGSRGFVALLGALVALLGVMLALSGIRRARFRSAVSSPGVLEVDEGRLTYLGPVLGGSADLDDLTEVVFRRTATGEAFWRLSHTGGPPLIVPEGAAGSERLLDALTPLPGFETGALVRAVQGREAGTTPVWRRADHLALT